MGRSYSYDSPEAHNWHSMAKTNVGLRVVLAFPRPSVIVVSRLLQHLFCLATLSTLLCLAHVVQQLVMTVGNHAVNDTVAAHDNIMLSI